MIIKYNFTEKVFLLCYNPAILSEELDLAEASQNIKLTIIYILIAFIFSILIRFIWVYQFSEYTPFFYNGQFMINTNDGYVWAEGARDLLSGSLTNPTAKDYFDQFHTPHDLSRVSSAIAQLTAFFAKVLPFSFETIIFYMSMFLGSLIVIPIILIGRTLNNLNMGFIAALLASIAWSYYNRTMVGYYDTDMLNIVLPMFLLWSIIGAIQTNKNIYLIITAVDILIYRWWYPQSYSLEFLFFILLLAYTLIFNRKNIFYYKLLAIMLFAMMNGDIFLRIAAVLVSYFIFRRKEYDKYIFFILAVAIVGFITMGGLYPILYKIQKYILTNDIKIINSGMELHFYAVMQTVREAGDIPFQTFANRISGHIVTFIISLFGYFYLLYKHRVMIFSLPLVGLGFIAYVGGLRFTIYAVPILAFGIAYLITEVANIMPTKKLQYLSMTAFTLAILFPNYKHIEAYKVPTVFNAKEVEVLDYLGKVADREDYVVSWWDYGYPIRYYADVKTLVDGGKHSGDVNFPVSFILTHSQEEAAKMARLDVEYTEKLYDLIDAKKGGLVDTDTKEGSTIELMTKDYAFQDTNDFLYALKTDISLPKRTRDIYIYLPFRMINIYPTVALFSNIDLMSGEKRKSPFYYVSRNFYDKGDVVQLGANISLDKRTLSLKIANKTIPLRRFVTTEYSKDMKLHKNVKLLNFSSDISLIYMKNYNIILLVDEKNI